MNEEITEPVVDKRREELGDCRAPQVNLTQGFGHNLLACSTLAFCMNVELFDFIGLGGSGLI